MFGFVKVMVGFRAREVSTRRIDRDDSDKLGGLKKHQSNPKHQDQRA